jgi:hypothetical protein
MADIKAGKHSLSDINPSVQKAAGLVCLVDFIQRRRRRLGCWLDNCILRRRQRFDSNLVLRGRRRRFENLISRGLLNWLLCLVLENGEKIGVSLDLKSRHDSVMISNHGETKQTDLPLDPVGRTFLLEPGKNGQGHRACIALADNPTRIQLDDKATEETIIIKLNPGGIVS